MGSRYRLSEKQREELLSDCRVKALVAGVQSQAELALAAGIEQYASVRDICLLLNEEIESSFDYLAKEKTEKEICLSQSTDENERYSVRFDSGILHILFEGVSYSFSGCTGLHDLYYLTLRQGLLVSATEIRLARPCGNVKPLLRYMEEMPLEYGGSAPDEVMDRKGIEQCLEALDELERKLEEPSAYDDPTQRLEDEEEYMKLKAILNDSTLSTGKSRVFGSRKDYYSVRDRIKAALKLIKKQCPPMADHFSQSITYGKQCIYSPKNRIDWMH